MNIHSRSVSAYRVRFAALLVLSIIVGLLWLDAVPPLHSGTPAGDPQSAGRAFQTPGPQAAPDPAKAKGHDYWSEFSRTADSL